MDSPDRSKLARSSENPKFCPFVDLRFQPSIEVNGEINTLMTNQEALTLSEFVHMLGNGVTLENVRGRIRRGSLAAFQDEQGKWHVITSEVKRILAEVENCQSCSNLATSFVIVKYHHQHRVEFTLCPDCAQKAQSAYSRQGGVLEVVVYPLQGEGWMKP